VTSLTLRDRSLALHPGRPAIMGIVNANPDSFSDAVRLTTLEAQVAHALDLVAQGAEIIDIGGESGVTYTGVTDAAVEIERVVPLVERLVAEGVVVSVDTWKPAVAEAALGAGAHLLNDVSGLRDPALADAAARTGAALVVMHTRAAPKEEHFADYGGDVVGDVLAFVEQRCELARAHGVADEQLIVDPGPDFAKTPEESIACLRAIDQLRALGRPWLAAVSRKYFLAAITGRAPADRLAGTLAAVGHAADHGAAIVRVHDVAAVADYLAVRAVLAGDAEPGRVDPDDDVLKWIRAETPDAPAPGA
jgi:dihydropteroate synthase